MICFRLASENEIEKKKVTGQSDAKEKEKSKFCNSRVFLFQEVVTKSKVEFRSNVELRQQNFSVSVSISNMQY